MRIVVFTITQTHFWCQKCVISWNSWIPHQDFSRKSKISMKIVCFPYSRLHRPVFCESSDFSYSITVSDALGSEASALVSGLDFFQTRHECLLGPLLIAFTIENARFRGQRRCLLGPLLSSFTIEHARCRGQIRCLLGPLRSAFTIENARFRDQIRCLLGPVLSAFTIENARFRGQIRCLLGPLLSAFTIENARFRGPM